MYPLRSCSSLLSLAVILVSAACRAEPPAEGPPRPGRVPPRAIWLSGADGGAWVALLSMPTDSSREVMALVFRPNGSIWYKGELALTPSSGPPVDLTDKAQLVGWDGEALMLKDGRSLRAVHQP